MSHPQLTIDHPYLTGREPQLVVVRVLQRKSHVLPDDRVQGFKRRIGTIGQDLLVAPVDPAVSLGNEVVDDLRFVAEEAVDDGSRVLDLVGDLPHRDVPVAVLGEQPLGRVEDTPPPVASLSLLAFRNPHALDSAGRRKTTFSIITALFFQRQPPSLLT